MQSLDTLPTACRVECDFSQTGYGETVFIDGAWIRAAAKRLYKAGYFIEDVTCLDGEEGFLLLYHFDHFDNPGRATVRVLLDRESPSVPSIADIFGGAEWHERECMDFFPVKFTGNPNPERLLLDPSMEEKPLLHAEKKQIAFMDLFKFEDIAACADDSAQGALLNEKLEAAKAAAEAAAAEEAAKAEAEAAAKAEAEANEAEAAE